VALGHIAHDSWLELLRAMGCAMRKSRYPFAHGSEHTIDGSPMMLDSYHVSIQNTNTGRLTAAMFDAILARAKELTKR
jgi:uracil-DNA glycosylase